MSAYFDQFPQVFYTFDGITAITITNFMARVAISDQLKSNVVLYSPYTIIDGETPEIVADKMYGDPTLHWIILLTNEIVDPRYDWCLTQQQLYVYCQGKYGSDPTSVYGTHHWTDPVTGYTVDQDYPGAVSVSNYEYEDALNEQKRVIKILNQSLVAEFQNEFQAAMTSTS